MKRIGNIRKKVLTKENLEKVVQHLCRNEKKKNWTPSMKRKWSNLLKNKDMNLAVIYTDLMNMNYTFHPFNRFTRNECGKIRQIYASCPEDQIVDNILTIALEYVFMEKKKIIHLHAYGSIKGRGQHELREKIIKILKNAEGQNIYVAICDTRQYYPTINHEIMIRFLEHHIKDKWLLWLCKATLERMPGDAGMALGLCSSNILGHIYHAAIDWHMTVEFGIKDYYRFCDDKIMIHKDKNFLHSAVRELQQEVLGLKQEVKSNWRVINASKERVPFLGGYINTTNAFIKPSGRRRIERRIRKEIKLPFNSEQDCERILKSWAGIMGGLKSLSIGNIISTWEQKYSIFFERLAFAKNKVEERRAYKIKRKKIEAELYEAIDIRSVENQIKYPLTQCQSFIPVHIVPFSNRNI